MASTDHDFLQGTAPGLLRALSDALHTLAQPVSVVHATLEVAAGKTISISGYQEVIGNCLAQMPRAAEALKFAHELVRIARDRPVPVPLDLRPLLAMASQDLACVLDKANISLQIRVPDDVPRILASAARMRQCLFYLVQYAQAASFAGDTLCIDVSSADEQVLIVVRNQCSQRVNPPAAPEEAKSLTNKLPIMALVEAIAISQEGSFKWQAHPFTARLSLPGCRYSPVLLD